MYKGVHGSVQFGFRIKPNNIKEPYFTGQFDLVQFLVRFNKQPYLYGWDPENLYIFKTYSTTFDTNLKPI